LLSSFSTTGRPARWLTQRIARHPDERLLLAAVPIDADLEDAEHARSGRHQASAPAGDAGGAATRTGPAEEGGRRRPRGQSEDSRREQGRVSAVNRHIDLQQRGDDRVIERPHVTDPTRRVIRRDDLYARPLAADTSSTNRNCVPRPSRWRPQWLPGEPRVPWPTAAVPRGPSPGTTARCDRELRKSAMLSGRWSRRRRVRVVQEHRHRGVPGEHKFSGQQPIGHTASGIDIGARIHLRPIDRLLGSHEGRRAADDIHLR
jgi:hypothetical protein